LPSGAAGGAIAYHAFTWFKLFPLTMPPIVVNGKRLEPWVVVG
jgi:fumarate reductase subunit C